MSYDEWNEVKLGEVCTLGDGAHAKVKRLESGILYLSSKNIQNGKLNLDSVTYISDDDYNRLFSSSKNSVRNLQAGDVLIGIIGTIGNVYVYKNGDKFGISSSIAILRPNSNQVNSNYLYFILSSRQFQKTLENVKGGSVQGYTNLPLLRSLPIWLPSLSVQKAIADTLSCLDDKIELNNRINKTLEEMAQAIFKSWFVDFEPLQDGEFEDSELGRIPKGWKVGTLQDMFKFKNGKKRPLTSGEYPVYGGNGVLGFSSEYNNENIVAIGRVGAYCGSLFFVNDRCWVSDNAISAQSKTNNMAFCYYTLLYLNLNERRIGTGQPLLTQGILNNIVFVIPDDKIIETFETTIKPILNFINRNAKENQALMATRDSILPKLISGEIRVPLEEVQ